MNNPDKSDSSEPIVDQKIPDFKKFCDDYCGISLNIHLLSKTNNKILKKTGPKWLNIRLNSLKFLEKQMNSIANDEAFDYIFNRDNGLLLLFEEIKNRLDQMISNTETLIDELTLEGNKNQTNTDNSSVSI